MIYDKIKEVCKKKGLSISYVEGQAGLSCGAICKWNESTPSVNNLNSVAKVLGVKIDDLLKE